MKFKRLFSISMVIILALAGSLWQPAVVSAGSGWLPVGMPGFSAVSTHTIKMALDSSNIPYVAFQDSVNTYGSGTVMKYNGSAWENVGPAPFSDSPARSLSLALDSHNTPYVAYQDYQGIAPYYYKATVMKYDGSAWVPVGYRGISVGTATNISLALDSNDTPYVSFKDYDTISGNGGYGVTVMKYNGSAWENVGQAKFSGVEVIETSLALDKNNTPYVAFNRWDHGYTYMATVMKYTGGAWVFVGSPNFSADTVTDIHLALDSNNTPYVAYMDYANGWNGKATVMQYTGSAWVPLGQAGFSAGEIESLSLALDSSNTPYVSYRDLTTGGNTTVMKFSGGTWVPVGSPGFASMGAGEISSLALDSNNTPYLAYPRGGDEKATVMKYYAVLPPADFNKTAPTNAATEVNPNATLSWAASDGADSYEYCYDTTNNNACDMSWISAGANTSVSLSGLNINTAYYWQVRAVNTSGTTYADGNSTAWWSFTTFNPPTATFTPTLTPMATATRTATPTITPTRTPATATQTFTSIGAQDGWILESSENSNVGGSMGSTVPTFSVGDDPAKRQYLSILSFSTGASLPDTAVITSVTLKVKKMLIFGGGNPVTIFGGFMVDIKNGFFGSTSALQTSDFQAIASKIYGPFNTSPVSDWYSIDLSDAKTYVNKLATGSGLTQIRLRFKLDDNNNAIANYLDLYSGNAPAAADRPQLVVTYYVP